mgnify:CR=1 FL=1
MGLVRLKNSFRIVNHPPTQPKRAAPVQQPPPGTQKKRRKRPTVSLIDNKHNSYRHFLLHLQQSFVNLHNSDVKTPILSFDWRS